MLEAGSVLRTRMSAAQAALLLFVATGDDKESPNFTQALDNARHDLAAFEATLDANQKARHGQDLRTLFDAQFRVMEGVMRLRAYQGFGAALEVVRSDTYQTQVSLGETLIGDIAGARAAALEEERNTTQLLGNAAFVLVVGGGLVAEIGRAHV